MKRRASIPPSTPFEWIHGIQNANCFTVVASQIILRFPLGLFVMINAAMSSEKTERSARPEQDQLILECMAIIRPLGGENDGKMGKKKQEVWEPLASLVNQGLGLVNDEIKRQKPTARPKSSFTAEELRRKFGDWRRAFPAANKDSGFGTRVGRGETGLPADTDEAAGLESALDKGIKRFKYFRECHAIFGACASVDTSLAQESLSPLKQLAAEGDNAASPGKPVRQAALSALKRLRADKSEWSSELTPRRQYVHDRELCIIGSPISQSGSPSARQRAQPSTSAPKQRKSKVQIAAEALTEAKAGSALHAARTT
jgi:hypothetical protein